MATLLFQPRCCLPSIAAVPASLSSAPTSRTSVRLTPPKSRGLAICRSTSENGGRPEEETGQAPIVFKDESNGIICYYDENGDLTCEGWDEGPHCQPDPQKPALRRRRRFTSGEMRARGMGEVVDFVNNKERMAGSLQEKVKESFESSEL